MFPLEWFDRVLVNLRDSRARDSAHIARLQAQLDRLDADIIDTETRLAAARKAGKTHMRNK
jgi:uncharacterized protein YdcH (DUF465 family)